MENIKHLSLNRRRLYVISSPVPEESKGIIDEMKKAGIPDDAFVINKEENDSSLATGEALSRLKKELITVVVDNNCISEQDRFSYAKIAEEANVDHCFISLNTDIDTIKNYASNGDHGQMYQTIVNKGRAYISGLRMGSEYEGIIYDKDYSFSFEDIETQLNLDNTQDPSINKNKGIITNFDGYIMGDIHGMYDDMIKTLNNLGFNTEDNYASHPRGKKIVFLGDLVDRGKGSADVLEFVMNTVDAGNAHLILGNHEVMLMDGLNRVVNQGGQAIPDSLASGDTLASVIRHKDSNFPERVYDFLSKTPSSLRLAYDTHVIECIHAPGSNVEGITPKKDRTHGKNIGIFDDSGFKDVKNPRNKITICGHMAQPNETVTHGDKEYTIPLNVSNIISLDFNGCSSSNNRKGYLGVIDVAKTNSMFQLKDYPLAKAAYYSMSKHETQPNSYRFIVAQRKRLAKELGDCLDKDQLDVVKSSNNYYLYLPKEEIYEEGKMYESLLFPDIAGSIGVDNGMKVLFIGPSKPYVLGDEKPLLNDDEDVLKVDTIRGFNVMVSRDEYGKGLIVTTASRENDSRYVKMAEETLRDHGLYDKINSFLGNEDRNMTLTFKVRHPEDKRHQVKADSEETYGITLISARKNQAYSPMLSEKYLDHIARSFNIERPNHQILKFSDVFDYKKEIQAVREGKEIDSLDGKSLTLRVKKDSQREMFSDYMTLPTASATIKRVYKDLTPNKVEEILATKGSIMKRQDYFYQKAMIDIINTSIKEGKLDEYKEKWDLKKLRERKDISPSEKRELATKYKEEKRQLVCDAVEKAFDEISNSEYRCNPVKYNQIKMNLDKAQEQLDAEKAIKERKRNRYMNMTP